MKPSIVGLRIILVSVEVSSILILYNTLSYYCRLTEDAFYIIQCVLMLYVCAYVQYVLMLYICAYVICMCLCSVCAYVICMCLCSVCAYVICMCLCSVCAYVQHVLMRV